MGLDMYLYAKRYVSDYREEDKPIKEKLAEIVGHEVSEVKSDAAYWRKANQIHAWFVDNIQDGEDDCKTYWIDRRKLQELIDLCKQVKANPEKAEELLAPRGGFFFGSTEVDDFYLDDLDRTIEQLEAALSKYDNNWEFYYGSSW